MTPQTPERMPVSLPTPESSAGEAAERPSPGLIPVAQLLTAEELCTADYEVVLPDVGTATPVDRAGIAERTGVALRAARGRGTDAADRFNSSGASSRYASMPLPGEQPEDQQGGVPMVPVARLEWAVRGVLVFLALSFATVLGIAAFLKPYTPDGQPRDMATHTQLGLPPCSAVELFGKPCPACGMTTSFALFMHGDWVAAARANWVGLGLAMFCAFGIPWGIASAIRGRYYWIRSLETTATMVVTVLLVSMLGRWLVVLATMD